MHTDEVPECASSRLDEHSTDRCWLVIRAYRGRRRVISMHEILAEAKNFFASAEEKLRDGDVILFRANLDTLSVASGATTVPDGNNQDLTHALDLAALEGKLLNDHRWGCRPDATCFTSDS